MSPEAQRIYSPHVEAINQFPNTTVGDGVAEGNGIVEDPQRHSVLGADSTGEVEIPLGSEDSFNDSVLDAIGESGVCKAPAQLSGSYPECQEWCGLENSCMQLSQSEMDQPSEIHAQTMTPQLATSQEVPATGELGMFDCTGRTSSSADYTNCPNLLGASHDIDGSATVVGMYEETVTTIIPDQIKTEVYTYDGSGIMEEPCVSCGRQPETYIEGQLDSSAVDVEAMPHDSQDAQDLTEVIDPFSQWDYGEPVQSTGAEDVPSLAGNLPDVELHEVTIPTSPEVHMTSDTEPSESLLLVEELSHSSDPEPVSVDIVIQVQGASPVVTSQDIEIKTIHTAVSTQSTEPEDAFPNENSHASDASLMGITGIVMCLYIVLRLVRSRPDVVVASSNCCCASFLQKRAPAQIKVGVPKPQSNIQALTSHVESLRMDVREMRSAQEAIDAELIESSSQIFHALSNHVSQFSLDSEKHG